MSAIVAAIWVIGCALLWTRVEQPVVRLLDALATRLVGLSPVPAPKTDPMPVGLLLSLTDESEPWAREQQLQRANELYARYGDWNRVMEALSR